VQAELCQILREDYLADLAFTLADASEMPFGGPLLGVQNHLVTKQVQAR